MHNLRGVHAQLQTVKPHFFAGIFSSCLFAIETDDSGLKEKHFLNKSGCIIIFRFDIGVHTGDLLGGVGQADSVLKQFAVFRSVQSYWHSANSPILSRTFTNEHLRKIGFITDAQRYSLVH